MENFERKLYITASPDQVYNALTTGIPAWWSEMFEGSSSRSGDVFTVRFGPEVHKTSEVTLPEGKNQVIWKVADAFVNVPELQNKTEWIGTKICWTIAREDNGVLVHLTHQGLQPHVECYEICSKGWHDFTDSLKAYLETGKGMPFTK